MICPPRMAYELASRWPNGQLRIVDHAGHALSEPGISAELVRAMNRIAGEKAVA
jgi:proline iminopeptidase